MDPRKRGIKPPFFRNNPQGKTNSREPRMIETGGQRPRKPPIQCWGCKVDHIFRDCPRISDKERVVHNVQRAERMGDMGRNVPRKYGTLYNNQAEYQLHMIEVEETRMKNLIWCSWLLEPKEKSMRWLSHVLWT
jgi:hypothetical protein